MAERLVSSFRKLCRFYHFTLHYITIQQKSSISAFILLFRFIRFKGKYDVSYTVNSVLGALVSITGKPSKSYSVCLSVNIVQSNETHTLNFIFNRCMRSGSAVGGACDWGHRWRFVSAVCACFRQTED